MVAEGEGANPMAPVLTDTSNPSSREVANHDSEKPLFGDEAGERQADSPGVVSPWDPSQVPDGGLRAWMVVSGAFCCVFCSFGWLNCEETCWKCPGLKQDWRLDCTTGIGIFQDYYQSHQLRNYSPSAVSWIASLELFIMFAGVRSFLSLSLFLFPAPRHEPTINVIEGIGDWTPLWPLWTATPPALWHRLPRFRSHDDVAM